MEIKVLWGFEGDPEKLKTENGRVLAGTVLDIDEERRRISLGIKQTLLLTHGMSLIRNTSAVIKSLVRSNLSLISVSLSV